jgi:excisionase family DNA binding protein
MVTAAVSKLIDTTDDEGYSTTEARRRLGGISKQTLGALVREGKIRVVRAGRRVIVPRSSIVAFLNANDDHAA